MLPLRGAARIALREDLRLMKHRALFEPADVGRALGTLRLLYRWRILGRNSEGHSPKQERKRKREGLHPRDFSAVLAEGFHGIYQIVGCKFRAL